MDGGICARPDLQILLEDFRRKQGHLKQITEVLEAETLEMPHVEKLLAIKGGRSPRGGRRRRTF